MKKRIRVNYWGLIACSLLLILTGCSQKRVEVYERPTQNVDTETISNDMEDETSSSPEIVDREVKDSEEAGDSPYEYTTSGGMISDNMYSNITADIGCLLEEGWRFLSKEEISELYSLTSEFADEENKLDNASADIYEIVAESTDDWANLNVIINYKGDYIIDEEDIAEQTMEPLVKSMKDIGYDDIEAEIITVPFIEGEHYAMKISATISGIPYYYCGVIYESMRYLINVNVASYEGDITEDILGMFDTPVKLIGKMNENAFDTKKKLSDKINSFQLQIEDDIYCFPMEYAEFSQNGWKVDENKENERIKSRCYEIVPCKMEELELFFYIYNPDTTVHSYAECVVSGVNISANDVDKTDELYIPGGFQIGVAKKTDILEKFGEPNNLFNKEDGACCVEYTTDNIGSSIRLYFDEKDILAGYVIHNPVAPFGYETTKGQDKEIIKYNSIKEMGDSVLDAIVNFDGELYQLPAPVSEFMKNGWEIEDPEITIPGNGLVFFDMVRDGISVHKTAYNFSEQACLLKNGVIVQLSSSDIYQKYFEVSGGIMLTMSEGELLNILKNGDMIYTIEKNSNGTIYTLPIGTVGYENYIIISFDDESIKYITIEKREMQN